ncbi:Disulfide-bond oxidoreductase YfcG [Chlorella vulgaris]
MHIRCVHFGSTALPRQTLAKTLQSTLQVQSATELGAMAAAAAQKAPITLYTAGTPNGWKASVCLEELGVPYAVHAIDLGSGEQKQDWYVNGINPNGRIPAIVDHNAGDLPVFESGAVLLYLAERDPERRLLPTDLRGRAETLSWLFWQMGGLGPMAGQADWFLLFAPERNEMGITRYTEEVHRLFGVMERRLEGRDWLAAGQYTIADIAAFTWVVLHEVWGISLAKNYPRLNRWFEAIKARPAVQRGCNVPGPNWVLTNTEHWQGNLQKADARRKGIAPPSSKPEK